MTSPNENNDAHYWFGRIDGKIDQLGDKMGSIAETVGRHDERLGDTEKRVEKLEEARISDAQQKAGDRGGLKAAVVGATSGALTGGVFTLVQLLVHK
ncbi:hypothetical protein AB0383_20665 [Amycolatopsis sp. NPDC051373]|uniref:hypothetical protein n=1 Tax=Amycolatopsis sp. NPDC051373 TaxID=3155801 RepID=UPI00344D2A83